MPRVAVVVRVAAICSATLAAAINATTAPALAPAYPVDKEVAGARVRVLGEFEFDLPAEGAAGLALGYVLEIKTPAVPVRRAGGGDGSFSAALQQVIGLKITLPYGAWPADTAAVPSLVVVDPAAAGPGGPWAADSSMVLHGPILVIEPADLALSKVAQLLKACCVLCLLPTPCLWFACALIVYWCMCLCVPVPVRVVCCVMCRVVCCVVLCVFECVCVCVCVCLCVYVRLWTLRCQLIAKFLAKPGTGCRG